jgi:sodium transport system permease protein
MSPLRRIAIVYTKEMRDHLRDRRSLLLSLVYPLLGPLLLAIVILIGSGALRSPPEEGPPLQVVYAAKIEDALLADLARFLAGQRIELLAADGDMRDLVRRGERQMALDIHPRSGPYGAGMQIDVVFDPSNLGGNPAANRLGTALNEFARHRSLEALRMAGIDPSLADPVRVVGHPVAAARDVASLFYGMIPALLMFMVFLGGTHLAIDTTAGERERGSLEPLLTAPVPRAALLVGKAGAAFSFTAITVVVHLLGFKLLLGAAVSIAGGYASPPGWDIFALLFVLAMPVMLLAVALQFLIATVTRSMKEAQIWLGLLPVVPAMPGMALAFTSAGSLNALAGLPLVGQLVAFAGLIGGNAAPALTIAFAAAATLVLGAAVFLAAIRLFERSTHLSPA